MVAIMIMPYIAVEYQKKLIELLVTEKKIGHRVLELPPIQKLLAGIFGRRERYPSKYFFQKMLGCF